MATISSIMNSIKSGHPREASWLLSMKIVHKPLVNGLPLQLYDSIHARNYKVTHGELPRGAMDEATSKSIGRMVGKS